jgi:hypothetical protein
MNNSSSETDAEETQTEIEKTDYKEDNTDEEDARYNGVIVGPFVAIMIAMIVIIIILAFFIR